MTEVESRRRERKAVEGKKRCIVHHERFDAGTAADNGGSRSVSLPLCPSLSLRDCRRFSAASPCK